VGDLDFARSVAADLHGFLAQFLPTVDSRVYALAVWADPVYGDIQISVGTESNAQAMLAWPGSQKSYDDLWGPKSTRWNSGDWHYMVMDFLSESTLEQLAPLKALVNDNSLDDATACGMRHRWVEIAVAAVKLTEVPAGPTITDDCLFYVELPELTPPGYAYMMLRTVDPERFHRVFPQWRRFADQFRAARDTEFVKRLQSAAAHMKAQSFPRDYPNPLSPALAASTDAVGLWWYVLAESNADLENALKVADASELIGSEPCDRGFPYVQYLV